MALADAADRDRERAWIAAAALAAVAVQIPLWDWTIDDAAISFAFARNVADGLGLVAYPGGERVEGYSNPLWVALLAAGELVGVASSTTSRLLGSLLAALAIVLAARVARLASADRATPVLAAGALVLNSQFAIWNGSGLENALFHVLLAAGIWRVLVESRGGPPWSAACFLGVALTRPEGVLYAAVGGAAAALFGWRDGLGLRAAARWLAAFALPFAGYHALRIAYFGWELPNPYYAKLSHATSAAFAWNGTGLGYLREWAGLSSAPERGPGVGQLFFAPVYLVGLVGALGRERRALGLCLALVLTSLFAAVAMRGDWMSGYRWLSYAAVPGSVLLGAGLAALRGQGARWRVALAVGVLGLFALSHARHFVWFAWNPPMSLYGVEKRVAHWKRVQQSLRLDRASVLDFDMGAPMWRADFELVDLGGLVDVPFAQHGYPEAFVREYVFEERRPFFAHVNARWGERSRIPELPEWREQYLPIPGFLAGRTRVHGDHYVRRDLLFSDGFHADPGKRVVFANGAALGFALEALPAGPGGHLLVSLGFVWQPDDDGGEELPQLHVFLATGERPLVRERFTPAHGWVPPAAWPDGEVATGHVSIPVPENLPPARYDLGFALVDGRGAVVPARRVRGSEAVIGGRGETFAAMAVGEARFPAAVTVLPEETYAELDAAERRRVRERSEASDCEAAEAAWTRLRNRTDDRSRRELRSEFAPVVAECYARVALQRAERAEKLELLARARAIAPDLAALDAAAAPVAEGLVEEGDAARRRALEIRARGDTGREPLVAEIAAWEEAYRAYSQALRADPSRAWARRRAEEARAHRLGLSREGAATRLAAADRESGA